MRFYFMDFGVEGMFVGRCCGSINVFVCQLATVLRMLICGSLDFIGSNCGQYCIEYTSGRYKGYASASRHISRVDRVREM